jgi:hypothetical protein
MELLQQFEDYVKGIALRKGKTLKKYVQKNRGEFKDKVKEL